MNIQQQLPTQSRSSLASYLMVIAAFVLLLVMGAASINMQQQMNDVGLYALDSSQQFFAPDQGFGNASLLRATRPGRIAIRDGRINHFHVAAPIAIFCTRRSIQVFNIDQTTAAGTAAFEFTVDQMRPYFDPTTGEFTRPAANQLLLDQNGVSLYLLTSGELQVNAFDYEGKPYDFQIDLRITRCRGILDRLQGIIVDTPEQLAR